MIVLEQTYIRQTDPKQTILQEQTLFSILQQETILQEQTLFSCILANHFTRASYFLSRHFTKQTILGFSSAPKPKLNPKP
jgi:hypothetical protein